MTKNRMNPKVDVYLSNAKKWREELQKLRMIFLDCQLTEELKWGKPCYAFQKRNIVIILPLKEHCALLFFKGALLNDANGILIKPGENTQAGRWIKFTAVREIVEMETILKAYIYEAIEVEKAGLKVNFKKHTELIFPEEFEKSNIVLIHAFKEYCALLFFKGALLKDSNGILIQQTENVQAARQIRFTNVREIVQMEPILKAYIDEAIEVEKAGLKVKLKKSTEFDIPEEFQKKLDKVRGLKTAFHALTPGRQRGYLLYFAAAKQSKTREARIEKYIPSILDGKGLNDL